MTKNQSISRRDFLFASAAAVGAVAAGPAIVPSTVLGAAAPSNRITMGLIGMGLQMGGHFSGMLNRREVQVLAVCDVDRTKRENAKARAERRPSLRKCWGWARAMVRKLTSSLRDLPSKSRSRM